jgi:hypothetical protein
MAGEVDGAEAAQGPEAQEVVGDEAAQAEQRQAPGEVSADGWQAQLAAKDEQIAALQGKVAETTKTAEATEAPNAEIAKLKRQMANERIDFALRSVGARNVKAACALLDDYEGDVSRLREAEPWMFADMGATSQDTSQRVGGTTSLEPAGVAGGSDEKEA